jgi:hypothetical protein
MTTSTQNTNVNPAPAPKAAPAGPSSSTNSVFSSNNAEAILALLKKMAADVDLMNIFTKENADLITQQATAIHTGFQRALDSAKAEKLALVLQGAGGIAGGVISTVASGASVFSGKDLQENLSKAQNKKTSLEKFQAKFDEQRGKGSEILEGGKKPKQQGPKDDIELDHFGQGQNSNRDDDIARCKDMLKDGHYTDADIHELEGHINDNDGTIFNKASKDLNGTSADRKAVLDKLSSEIDNCDQQINSAEMGLKRLSTKIEIGQQLFKGFSDGGFGVGQAFKQGEKGVADADAMAWRGVQDFADKTAQNTVQSINVYGKELSDEAGLIFQVLNPRG